MTRALERIASDQFPRRPRPWRTLATSAAIHIGLLTIFFAGAAGAPISGESGDEGVEGMTVTLVPPPSALPAQSEATIVESLFEKYDQAPADEALLIPVGKKANRLEALADQLRDKNVERPDEVRQEQFSDSNSQENAQRKAGAPGESKSTGALWGRIEPCWKKQGYAPAVPVTLEVSFDARGRLDKPPRILRSKGAALDETRLRAEAQAISALNACLPKDEMRFGSAVHRVEFPAG